MTMATAPFKEEQFKRFKAANHFLFCQRESDVEDGYIDIFRTAFKNNGNKLQISHPHNTDGLMIHKTHGLRVLMEYKFDFDLKDNRDQVKVLIQTLYYLKKFENAGDELPSVIFVGDINECFMLHVNSLLKYLDADIDWSIPPSQASDKNPELIRQMIKDDDLHPWVYDIKGLQIERVLNELCSLSNGEVTQIRITEKNVHRIFSQFRDRVISKADKYTANQLVGMFIGMVLCPDDYYLHPNKKHTLVTKDYGEVKVATNPYKAFVSHHERTLTSREKEVLTAVCDRLIEDTTRRFKGEFYTPTEWVDEAHKMISESLGDDWKEEYVVWDPACGTLNLTRDYKFKELYCSTLNQSDLDIGDKYNPEATKFQYDFLNDTDLTSDIFGEDKIAPGLLEAFKQNKKIVVFMNPPYKTANDIRTDESISRASGVAQTSVGSVMKFNGVGKASQQLYAQFLYKVMMLREQYNATNVVIATYSSQVFMTGPSFKKFRCSFTKSFQMVSGMVFNAGHFNDTSDTWGISFTVWGQSENNDWSLVVKDSDADSGEIVSIGTKRVYNIDGGVTGSKWVRSEVKNVSTCDMVAVNHPVRVKEDKVSGRGITGQIGYLHSNANSVYHNAQVVGMYSAVFSAGHGIPVIESGFEKAIALFAARKSIETEWLTAQDEYSAPNEAHTEYSQWNNDAIVYSLFNNHSQQSSLRDVEYKGKSWDIENEWFWMSNTKIRQLANEQGNDIIYQDTKQFPKERFVYKKLQEVTLSSDAQEVLDMASALVRKTFEYRDDMGEGEELHLNAWDAGWYQIKRILKEYFPDDLKTFVEKYKAFEDRMREGVYKFGFLKGGFEPA